jgi:hypothetical protein
MEIVYWIFIALFLLFVLWGIKDWVNMFKIIWHDNGWLFSLLTIILFVLFIIPSIVKDYAPNYYGFSIWILILYVVGLFIYRFTIRFKD